MKLLSGSPETSRGKNAKGEEGPSQRGPACVLGSTFGVNLGLTQGAGLHILNLHAVKQSPRVAAQPSSLPRGVLLLPQCRQKLLPTQLSSRDFALPSLDTTRSTVPQAWPAIVAGGVSLRN